MDLLVIKGLLENSGRDRVGANDSHAGGYLDKRGAHDRRGQVAPVIWQVRVAPDCQRGFRGIEKHLRHQQRHRRRA